MAFGILCGVGKRTLTRSISFQGNTQKDWSGDYKLLKKTHNLSVQFVNLTKELRERLNITGHADQRLLEVVDGSFCNRTVFGEDWNAQNVSIVARCRKDIVLCRRARGKGRRFYSLTKFTPCFREVEI